VTGWVEQFRSLGLSLLEVFRAEWEALRGDFARSGRHFAVALALLGAAAVVLFWTLGALIFALGAVLAIWLEVWAAALIVVAAFALLAVVLGLVGLRRLKRAENPAASFRRRLDDHVEWWQETLLREDEAIEVAAVDDLAARPGRRPYRSSRPPAGAGRGSDE
jgi:Putative Actinobacterial Holin-X, holin superfamily III